MFLKKCRQEVTSHGEPNQGSEDPTETPACFFSFFLSGEACNHFRPAEIQTHMQGLYSNKSYEDRACVADLNKAGRLTVLAVTYQRCITCFKGRLSLCSADTDVCLGL